MPKKSVTFTKQNITGTSATFPNFNSQRRLKILFVCLGNICRSPTAEILFNYLHKDKKAVAYSRGTDYWHYGEPICPLMQQVLEDEGIPVPKRRSKILNPSEISEFRLVIPVDKKVELYLRHVLAKKYHKKILPFTELTGGKEVPDPYRKDLNTAKLAYSIIRKGIEKLTLIISATSPF